MGIKATFTKGDVRKVTSKWLRKVEFDIFHIMSFIGEEFVNSAKGGLNISGAFPKGDYTDRTANLRSSLGYFVLVDGKVTKTYLEGTSEGQAAARAMLTGIPPVTRGFQLVGVAGMDYASRLEALGFNVITSQATIALIDLSQMLQAYARGKNINLDIPSSGVTVQMR